MTAPELMAVAGIALVVTIGAMAVRRSKKEREQGVGDGDEQA